MDDIPVQGEAKGQRTAVILFNLGGPLSLDAVRPFLTSLFSDPAILTLPQPFRGLLARIIAARRTPHAQEIYRQMGGGSPLLPNTEAQARALEAELGAGFKCFVAMRYAPPRAREVVRQVADFRPERIILLPLYPQYSRTTSGSSVAEWGRESHAVLRGVPVDTVCCYPTDPGFIRAQGELIRPLLEEAQQYGPPRLLFSAHGLPEKIIRGGDPYQAQCEATAQALAAFLGMGKEDNGGAWLNTYQSRVGPLKWIGPATDDEIRRAGEDRVLVVVAPIAFVSEHSETLVELDVDYAHLARTSGVPFYGRAPTVGTHPAFIAGLADLVRQRLRGINPDPPACCLSAPLTCPCRKRNT